MFSSEKFCRSVFQARVEGSVSFHLAAVKAKISSVKDQGVLAIFCSGLYRKRKQNLFTSDRNMGEHGDVRSVSDQYKRSDRKMMLFTWKTIQCHFKFVDVKHKSLHTHTRSQKSETHESHPCMDNTQHLDVSEGAFKLRKTLLRYINITAPTIQSDWWRRWENGRCGTTMGKWKIFHLKDIPNGRFSISKHVTLSVAWLPPSYGALLQQSQPPSIMLLGGMVLLMVLFPYWHWCLAGLPGKSRFKRVNWQKTFILVELHVC